MVHRVDAHRRSGNGPHRLIENLRVAAFVASFGDLRFDVVRDGYTDVGYARFYGVDDDTAAGCDEEECARESERRPGWQGLAKAIHAVSVCP